MNNQPLSFNLGTNHPLIKREQTYTLDRKLITIHSEDRDTCKWPSSSEFEVDLPETIQNVQSIRLAETAMPSNFYNISKQFQNTAMAYSTHTLPQGTIELCDGFYTPLQLACVLTKLLNDIEVYYDPIIQKFIFCSANEFTLDFDKMLCYTPECNNIKQAWCRNIKWGLGYYLGFEKLSYSSVGTSSLATNPDCSIKNCLSELIKATPTTTTTTTTTPTTTPTTTTPPSCLGTIDYHQKFNDKYILIAPKFPKLEGEQVIYMEVEKYNTYDEITPYPTQTNSMFSNTYNGRVNSAFAKIPVQNGPSPTGSQTYFDSRNDSFVNISYHDPPIEKIKKLKFKFRYHGGEIVDFQDSPFTFTVEFNSLRNDIGKDYKVRMPFFFM